MRDVHTLIVSLGSDDGYIRFFAIVELADMRQSISPRMIELLRSGIPQQQASAANVLGRLCEPLAVTPLVDLMAIQDAYDRGIQARLALVKIGTPAISALSAKLTHGEPEERSTAAWILSQIKDSAVVTMLITALNDSDGAVRMWAAWGLGLAKAQEAVAALMPLLDDPVEQVQDYASDALGKIGRHAAQALVAKLRDTSHPTARCYAAKALLHMPVPEFGDPDVRRKYDEAMQLGTKLWGWS